MNTIKYSTCDLNDNPEQLYVLISTMRRDSSPTMHTLEVFIFCKRMKIEERWEKSANPFGIH